MPIEELQTKLTAGARAHLVGIGGVSMSPLAEVLHGNGLIVSGSDEKMSPVTDRLRSLGISVVEGHSANSVHGADLLIRTAAVRDDNVEIAEARALGIPVYERAEAWGYIMRGYANAVCVAGAHGKTTTTSMVTQILLAADADPTVMIGGTLSSLGSGYRVGQGDTIVLESCEYYDSFLQFRPTVSVILNIDADHLDYFGTLDNVKTSFAKFAELTPASGKIICNADDENTIDTMRGLNRDLFTFGFSPTAHVRAEDITFHDHGSTFDVVCDDRVYSRVTLRVPGKHNIANALAAAAVAVALDLPGEAVAAGLAVFTGAGRRFEFKGTLNGADIYDDYAHHPTELKMLLDTTLNLDYKRVLLAFQPHTYSRTAAHFQTFVEQLQRPHKTFLAEIYAAREINTYGITSSDLVGAIPEAVLCPDFAALEAALAAEAQPGDLILTVGAGELDKVAESLAKRDD